MTAYVPGIAETDLKKIILALQQLAAELGTQTAPRPAGATYPPRSPWGGASGQRGPWG